MREILTWPVLNYDVNRSKIMSYDVLCGKQDRIKQVKKLSANKQEFGEWLKKEIFRQYHSRAEYELILTRPSETSVKLTPWVGSVNPEEESIILNDEDWVAFSKSIYCNWWGDYARIDIYQQVMFKWDQFLNYCWNTRLPYERKRKQDVCGDKVTAVNKITDEFKLDTALCSDPEWVHKQNELFNSAEHWLNYHGIKTRTEYGNLLPTYNLFLEIGDYLQRRLTEENDE